MKRLLLVVILGLISFYVAWPAVSLWQIYSAIKQEEPETLEQKIDFVSVRESMRPTVRMKISERIDEVKTRKGTAGAIAQLLSGNVVDHLTSVVLERIVTPVNMIRLANEPGTLPEKINRIVSDEIGRVAGGLRLNNPQSGNNGNGIAGAGDAFRKSLEKQFGGLGNVLRDVDRGAGQNAAQDNRAISAEAVAAEDGERDVKRFGLSNVKAFGFAGFLAFDIGLARNPQADAPDLTLRMAFTDMDWKLIQIVPNPDQI